MEEFRAVVSGRVQMVMFRDFTRRKARSLGLTGAVCNLDDGTVEVVAQGSEESLTQLLESLHRGPLFAKVTQVDVEWREPTKNYEGFEIIY